MQAARETGPFFVAVPPNETALPHWHLFIHCPDEIC